MTFFLNYDISMILSLVFKWYTVLISIAGMIISFIVAFNSDNNWKKPIFCTGCVLIIVSIGIVVLLFKGTYNQETVTNYSNDGTYFGQTKDGMAHGNGRYYDKNGNLIYMGQFKNNLYDGEGKQYDIRSQEGELTSVLLYEGTFKEGLWSGTGKEYETKGKYKGDLKYEGDFYNGKYNGKGKYYISGELEYEGGFCDSKRYGFGRELYINSQGEEIIEIGLYSDDTLNGYGEQYIDGTLIHKGNYLNGARNGYGIEYDDNGRWYEGYWKEGELIPESIITNEEEGKRASSDNLYK